MDFMKMRCTDPSVILQKRTFEVETIEYTQRKYLYGKDRKFTRARCKKIKKHVFKPVIKPVIKEKSDEEKMVEYYTKRNEKARNEYHIKKVEGTGKYFTNKKYAQEHPEQIKNTYLRYCETHKEDMKIKNARSYELIWLKQMPIRLNFDSVFF